MKILYLDEKQGSYKDLSSVTNPDFKLFGSLNGYKGDTGYAKIKIVKEDSDPELLKKILVRIGDYKENGETFFYNKNEHNGDYVSSEESKNKILFKINKASGAKIKPEGNGLFLITDYLNNEKTEVVFDLYISVLKNSVENFGDKIFNKDIFLQIYAI